MSVLTLEQINQLYEPVWQALKPSVIESYEANKKSFQVTLKHFVALLEMTSPPATVVELACGTGIASVEFARLGYQVTGIDCSPTALEIAQILADHVNVNAHWLQQDMRSIYLDTPVDYILLWDVVFGIFASHDEDMKVLQQISSALKTGGRCLLQFYNKSFAVQNGIEHRYSYDSSLDLFLAKPDFHDLSITRIKLYSDEEWLEMLTQSGFKIVRKAVSRVPGDPQQGYARIDYIVAERL